MNTQANKIRRAIMRRVYTVFAARIVSHPVIINVALFMVALTAFREVVFVKRVMETLVNMPLGQLPQFFIHALMRGEVVALAALGIMIFTALSLRVQIKHLVIPTWRHKLV